MGMLFGSPWRLFPRPVYLLLAAVYLSAVSCGESGRGGYPPPVESKVSAAALNGATTKVSPELFARAAADGSVKVIVKLSTPFTPAGGLPASAAVAQEAAIARDQQAVLNSLGAADHAEDITYQFIPYMAMTVNPNGLNGLSNNPRVSLVAGDVEVQATLAQSVPLVQGDLAWSSGFTGAGWTVAILDTGVDKTHPFLSGKVVSEACYSYNNTANGYATTCPNGLTSQVGAGAGVNCNTAFSGCDHGTHVAGIAAGTNATFSGVAKGANIIAVQVFTYDTWYNSVTAFDSNILSGLNQVYALRTTYNIASVNMSLGGGLYSAYCDTSVDGGAIKAAIDTLASANIATVIASGNNSSASSISFPGCISSAVSVGATTKSDTVASYSNSASFLSLLAPGSSINSSVPGAGYALKSGTSMATPHVAGAWAVYKQANPTATVAQALSAFSTNGSLITDTRNSVTKPRINVYSSIVPPSRAVMQTPAPNSVLPGVSATFTWNDVGATKYELWFGTSTGTKNTGSSPALPAGTTSYTFNSLPVNSSQVYVRLISFWGSVQVYNDYVYTASSPPKAAIITPAPGTVLPGPSATFTWNDVGAGTYGIWFGTSPGTYNIGYTSWYPAGTKSAVFSSLPVDGSTVYVRMFTVWGSLWLYNDYVYTAASPSKAALITPAPGSVLPGASATFTWNDVGAGTYGIWFGTSPGTFNIGYTSWYPAGTTSATFSSLPVNGSTVYVRMFTVWGSAWLYNDYVYTAASPSKAALITPAPGSVLPGASATFTWNDVGAGTYGIWFGTSPGTYNIGYTSWYPAGTTSAVFSSLPVNGSTVYVRMFTVWGSAWLYNDYVYTAASPSKAALITPAPGTVLPGPSATFTWNDVGAGTYGIWFGTSPGTYNIGYTSWYPAGTTSAVFSSLPVDGSTVYVRMFTVWGSAWLYNDYIYTAASPSKAALITPAPGTVLPGPSATFTWNDVGAGTYGIWFGTSPGTFNIGYTSWYPAGTTSAVFSSLPVDGSTVYVRMFTVWGSAWLYNDYVYTAFK